MNVMINLFAERLKEARARAGMSARALDKLAGVTRGHTSLIESGTRPNVELKTASALARALSVSIDWLVGDSDNPLVSQPHEYDFEEDTDPGTAWGFVDT